MRVNQPNPGPWNVDVELHLLNKTKIVASAKANVRANQFKIDHCTLTGILCYPGEHKKSILQEWKCQSKSTQNYNYKMLRWVEDRGL